MKRWYCWMLIGQIACNGDLAEVSPDARVTKLLEAHQSKLTSASHGWLGVLQTQSGPSYSFCLQFSDDGRVQMWSDISRDCAESPSLSSYSVRAALKPSLSFDSYSHLHLLSDPDPAVNQGVPGQGYSSDFEFSFVRETEDSVILLGNHHNSSLVLVKLSENAFNLWRSERMGNYITAIDAHVKGNPYLTILNEDNSKTGVFLDLVEKTLHAYTPVGNTYQQFSTHFVFTPEGISLLTAFRYDGHDIQALYFDALNQLLYLRTDRRVDVKTSAEPIVPLHYLLGTVYTLIDLPHNPLELPGWSYEFRTDWLYMANGFYSCCLLGTGNTAFRFNENQTLQLDILVQSTVTGTWYLLRYPFRYDFLPDNTLLLTGAGEGNPNGEYLRYYTTRLLEELVGHRFHITYQADGRQYLASLQSVSHPEFTFTGHLR